MLKEPPRRKKKCYLSKRLPPHSLEIATGNGYHYLVCADSVEPNSRSVQLRFSAIEHDRNLVWLNYLK